MNAAGMLKRAAMISLTVAGLTLGSTLTPPAAMANAAGLPDSHVGAPDVGYPSIGPWRGWGGGRSVMAVLPASGDVGYPNCPTCGQQATVPASGDVGYPSGCPWCTVLDQPRGASAGDTGYPNCPSCGISSQPERSADDDMAWS